MKIGIIGYGEFGKLVETLAKKYLPNVNILIYDHKDPKKDTVLRQGVCQSDIIIPCVPISAFEKVVENVVSDMNEESIIFDICTVKGYTEKVLQKYERVRYVCTHPMFGPASYRSNDERVEGFRWVFTTYQGEKKHYDILLEYLRAIGIKIIEMSSDAHDKMLAETLFVTHYVGQIVKRVGYERTEIDTYSFGQLMSAMESVRHDTDLFHDVYHYNPYCKLVAEQLLKTHKEVYRELELRMKPRVYRGKS